MMLPGVVASQLPPAGGGGPVAHRYWRAVLTDHAGTTENLLQMNEVRLIDETDTEHTPTFTASSTFSGSFLPSNLGDSSDATSWAGAVGAIPATIFMDLGSAMDIRGIKLKALSSELVRMASAFTIGWSDDAVTYTDVAKFEGEYNWIGADPRLFKLSFDLWRIRISANNAGSRTSIMEVELRTALAGADETTPGVDPTTLGRIGGSRADSGGQAKGAFDNSSAFTLAAAQVAIAMPNFLDYRFDTPKEIIQFTMQSRVDGFSTEAPKDFKLQRSTDNGFNFTDIATFSGVTVWSTGEVKVFNV